MVPLLTRGFEVSARVVDETEIDRLLLKGDITPSQHAALENFLAKLIKGGFVGLRSPSYDAPISADPALIADRKSEAIRDATRILSHLQKTIGKSQTNGLMNLVLSDRPWLFGKADLEKAVQEIERTLRG